MVLSRAVGGPEKQSLRRFIHPPPATRTRDQQKIVRNRILIPALCLLIGLAGLIWCTSDAAARRAALFTAVKLHTPEEVNWDPDDAPDWFVVDSSETLRPYKEKARAVLAPNDPSTTEDQAFQLFRFVAELGGPNAYKREGRSAPSDNVRTMMEQADKREFQGNCSDYSYILQTLSQAAGLDSRVVGMHADVWMDGWGHALNEIYIPEKKTWVAMDPLRNVYFTDSHGNPLSLLDVRTRLVDGDGEDLEVVQGEIQALAASPEFVLRYYRKHIDRISYQGSLDLIDSRDRIYDSWLAQAFQIEDLPRPIRRALESGLWNKDRHYLYTDRSEVDDTLTGYFVFRAALALILIGALWMAGLVLIPRRN